MVEHPHPTGPAGACTVCTGSNASSMPRGTPEDNEGVSANCAERAGTCMASAAIRLPEWVERALLQMKLGLVTRGMEELWQGMRKPHPGAERPLRRSCDSLSGRTVRR